MIAMVRQTLDDLCARTVARPRRVVTLDHLRTLLREMPVGRPIERRDKVVVILLCALALRHSHILRLRADEVEPTPDGGLFLGRTTRGFRIYVQPGDDPKTDPAAALNAWLADLPDRSYPLIPSMRNDTIRKEPLIAHALACVVKDACRKILGAPYCSLDFKRALVRTLADAGFSTAEIMDRCFFKNADSVHRIVGTRGQPFSSLVMRRRASARRNLER